MQSVVPIETFSVRARVRDERGFRFFDGRFPPGFELPWHTHENASIFVIVEGAIEERCDRRNFDCVAGSVVAKPAGERHRDRVSARGVRAIAIELCAGSRDAARDAALRELAGFESRRALSLVSQVAAEMRARDTAAPLALEGLALELAATVVRFRDGTSVSSRAPAWLAQIRDVLTDCAVSPVPTMRELGRICDRHPAYLARAFRRFYGCTIGEWVRRARLEWAARELLTSDHSLAALALRAGFCDQSHFSRAFRRYTRLTPRAYKEAGKQGSRDPGFPVPRLPDSPTPR